MDGLKFFYQTEITQELCLKAYEPSLRVCDRGRDHIAIGQEGTVKLRRSSRNTGARTVVTPRWLRCAIAPPPLIGRSEASTGRQDGAGG